MLKPLRFSSLLLAVLLAVTSLLVACGKKDPQTMLHGEQNKKWVLDKQTDASGDKVAQDDDDQSWTFYANGTYNMATSAMTQSGKYRFDDATKTITMTSGETDMETSFAVTELSNDHLTLSAANGAEVKLKSAN